MKITYNSFNFNLDLNNPKFRFERLIKCSSVSRIKIRTQ